MSRGKFFIRKRLCGEPFLFIKIVELTVSSLFFLMSMTKLKSFFDRNKKMKIVLDSKMTGVALEPVDCMKAVLGCTYIFLEIPQIVVEIETQMFAHFVNDISQVVYFVL